MHAKEAEILGKYLPVQSIDYCFSLWKTHRIQLTITKPRKSIYGNYSFRNGIHSITVNGNLGKEAFLVTYLHEVAHLLVRKNHQRRTKPHGREWQTAFSELMKPVLHEGVFPPEILDALKIHLLSPAASSCTDARLHALLNPVEASENQKKVMDLAPGQAFRFQGKNYLWIRSLRSRCEVRCMESGRLYRITATAMVETGDFPTEHMLENSLSCALRRLPDGQKFLLDMRIFRKIELRRSRVLCEEISSGMRYLISGERVIPGEGLLA
jgi:SprT protein